MPLQETERETEGMQVSRPRQEGPKGQQRQQFGREGRRQQWDVQRGSRVWRHPPVALFCTSF